MVLPFRPQKVQCARSPHQHPRDVSNMITGFPAPGKLRVYVSMNGS